MQAMTVGETNHRTLLPEPATNIRVGGVWCSGEQMGRTFAMDPQERRGRFPLFENTALEEPGRCSLVVCLSCDIMVCRRIRRREPVL